MWYLIIAPVAFIAYLFITYKKEMNSLKEELISGSQTMELTTGKTEYVIDGDGIPVIISHGGAGGYDQGRLTAALHLSGGFKVISVSRFGHLRTELPEQADASLQADAYAELLDKLQIEKAAIIGSSGGGPSAIQFAMRHPDKCTQLVLSCAVSGFLPERNLKVYDHPFMYYLMIKYFKKLVLKQIGVTSANYASMSSSEKQGLDALFKTMNPIELRKEGLVVDVHEWAKQKKWDDNYDWASVQCETLIIHAVDDKVIPFEMAEETSKRIPRAELLKLADGGHLKLDIES